VDSGSLIRRQRIDQRTDCVVLVDLIDQLEVSIVEEDRLHAQSPARVILDATAGVAVDELVVGDPKEPRNRRRWCRARGSVACLEGGRKHLGGQVGCEFGAAGALPHVEQDAALVAGIELAKRLGLRDGSREQLEIASCL